MRIDSQIELLNTTLPFTMLSEKMKTHRSIQLYFADYGFQATVAGLPSPTAAAAQDSDLSAPNLSEGLSGYYLQLSDAMPQISPSAQLPTSSLQSAKAAIAAQLAVVNGGDNSPTAFVPHSVVPPAGDKRYTKPGSPAAWDAVFCEEHKEWYYWYARARASAVTVVEAVGAI